MNERDKHEIFVDKKLHIYDLLKNCTETIRREQRKDNFNRFIDNLEIKKRTRNGQ